MANRIDQRTDEARVAVTYRLKSGATVWLSLTRFEKGFLLARAEMLRDRYARTMIPDFRLKLEAFESRLVATYSIDALGAA